MEFQDFLAYGFVQRALITGSFVALLCSTLGVFLVLRRFSLIGDGLAHATFGSVALSLFLQTSPLSLSIPLIMLCAVGILKLTEKAKIYGDAAIGMVAALGIASGALFSHLAGGFNIDLFSYLFGSILSVSLSEMYLSIALAVIVILTTLAFYHELMFITFDEETSRISGINAGFVNTIFVLLTAVTVILSMKVVGILLISALFIFPPVTALQIAKSFKGTILLASLSAITSLLAGIYISFILDLPAGATIVLINFILFLTAVTFKKIIHIKE